MKKFKFKSKYTKITKKKSKTKKKKTILIFLIITLLLIYLYPYKNAKVLPIELTEEVFAEENSSEFGQNFGKVKIIYENLIEQLGKPYVYGEEGPNSFDCSGLVKFAYSKIGINMPRVAYDQAQVGIEVNKEQLKFGDIVFFANDGNYINHAGIYIGHGYMIHAPKTGDNVKISSINLEYYRDTFKKGIRLIN